MMNTRVILPGIAGVNIYLVNTLYLCFLIMSFSS